MKNNAIWQLIKPFWVSEEKKKAWTLLVVIILLVLAMVYINVLVTDWNRNIYDALQNKNYAAFKALLFRFSYLAFFFIVIAICRIYFTQLLQIRWRSWMTARYMANWLRHHAYYRIELKQVADNPDQRIAEDLDALTSTTLSLLLGFISSLVTLVSFVSILWMVSGALSFTLMNKKWEIPGYMVWFAIAYAGIGSWIIWWVGKKLVTQKFNAERLEANFRFGLIRVREHAEAVALYRGETLEGAQLGRRFGDIVQNWRAIMRTTFRLNIAMNFYGQFSIIFPMLVSAPRYFSGAISLGVLMQISSAFGQVQDALSWFINAFSTLADWKASLNRLAGFNAVVEQMQNQKENIHVGYSEVGSGSVVAINQLGLSLPDDRVLIEKFDGDIAAGARILVSGPSGCGKSTLFRAVAGIWPYGSGTVQVQHQLSLLFVPQSSYLPIATLRAATAYPSDVKIADDERICHYLDLCRLPHLKGMLDTVGDWSRRLSPGEQQRLAFVRIFLNRPQVVFLDEASSAMDGETEAVLYALLFQELPDITVISIAHRETVARYHQERWHFSRISVDDDAPRFTVSRQPIQAGAEG